MDVSPQLLREVEFREQWRGYNPDEVDDFLERVAAALERLQDRLRETADRAVRAERRLAEESGDEALKRTLVLAQRTAQSAVDEAAAEAETLLAEAREQAAATMEAAEQRAAEVDADIQARAASSVQALAAERAVLEADVVALQAWVDLQQRELTERLRRHLELLEGPGRLSLSTPPVLSERPDPPTPASVEATAGDAEAEDEERVEAPSGSPDEPQTAGDEGDVPAGTEIDADTDTEMDTEIDIDAESGATDDDPFLAELRRAVDDPEPLGPRPEVSRDPADRDDELTPAGRFKRRRRS